MAAMLFKGSVVNIPPNVNAGADQTISLPTNSVTLTASVFPGTGTITNVTWTLIAGGTAGGTITTPNSTTTTITGLTAGANRYMVTVTDSNSLTASDDVLVTVLPYGVSTNYIILYNTIIIK